MREATKQDLPRGREAQCILCWRIFGSDSTCELHKPYRKPVADICKEPASIGLETRDRRGLTVWVQPAAAGAFWEGKTGSDEVQSGSEQQPPGDRPKEENSPTEGVVNDG